MLISFLDLFIQKVYGVCISVQNVTCTYISTIVHKMYIYIYIYIYIYTCIFIYACVTLYLLYRLSSLLYYELYGKNNKYVLSLSLSFSLDVHIIEAHALHICIYIYIYIHIWVSSHFDTPTIFTHPTEPLSH